MGFFKKANQLNMKSNMNLIYNIQRRKKLEKCLTSVFDTLDGQIDNMVELTCPDRTTH